MIDDNNTVTIKDFTITRKIIPFKIDDDVFEAYAILGLPQLQSVTSVAGGIRKLVDEGRHDAIFDMFDSILTEESAALFRERGLSRDPRRVLDMRRQVLPVIEYLLEEYGVRPTQQSSDSSAG